jgi:hypothetical protein
MTGLPCIILLATAALLFGWLVAEVRGPQWARITLGIVSLIMSFGIAVAVASIFRLQYDVEYGGAAAKMIDEILVRLDSDDEERLVRDLRELRADVAPSYEVPPFEMVVEEFVNRNETSAPKPQPRVGP